MVKLHKLVITLTVGMLFIAASCDNSTNINYKSGAIPPKKAVDTYHVVDGFQVQLFASEPQIQDPTDMAVDADGHMYVVEMVGYPLEMNHRGKVMLLKDKNGDGVMDASVTFADHLMFPSGVMPWKGGILITDAPYVVFFKDTTGDGRADVRDTVLTGFAFSNPQVNVNDPIYGLDNWIYLANFGALWPHIYTKRFDDLGEKIRFWRAGSGPQLPKDANHKSVRFKPGEKKLQMLSSHSQFGMTFNEWGDLFNNYNNDHIYQQAIAAEYVGRNPNLLLSSAIAEISDHGRKTIVYQIREDSSGQLITTPQSTTATGGITYYSGGLFPPPFDKNVTFVTESAYNLVHADKLTPDGAVYRASRLTGKQAFLASTDEWARPVNIYIGPDGAMYVLDFYQKFIEHPEWMAKKVRKHGDLYAGQQMGRIYRITPTGTPNASWTTGLSLGDATPKELVEHLDDANRWWRRAAQRLLVTRGEKSVVSRLKEKVVEDTSAVGRLHSLWTLEGLNALTVDIIEKALRDEAPGIRRDAIRLAERFMDRSDALKRDLYAMANDPNAQVRYQLLNTLGYLNSNRAWEVRKQLLFQDIGDKWMRIAALTAEDVEPNHLLKAVMNHYGKDNSAAGSLAMTQRLSKYMSASGTQQEIATLFRFEEKKWHTGDYKLQKAILRGLLLGLQINQNQNLLTESDENRLVTLFFSSTVASIRNLSLQLLQMKRNTTNDRDIQAAAKQALKKAQDPSLDVAERAEMLKFLTLTTVSPYASPIKRLITNTESAQIQKAAITVLAQMKGVNSSRFLVTNWKSVKTGAKSTALKTFLPSKARASLLLKALTNGRIPTQDLGVTVRSQLMRYDDKSIRKKATGLLAGNLKGGVPDRFKKAFERLSQEVRHVGNLSKGAKIFKTSCAACHQIQGAVGTAYGPDLGTVAGWSNHQLLYNILNPNASIAPGFNLYTIQLKNGKRLTGMIKSKSANAIKLQTGPQSKQIINRKNVKSMKAIEGVSPMPKGFGKRITPKQMINLIAYIRESLD